MMEPPPTAYAGAVTKIYSFGIGLNFNFHFPPNGRQSLIKGSLGQVVSPLVMQGQIQTLLFLFRSGA